MQIKVRKGRDLDSKHVATLGGGSIVFVVATSATIDGNGNTVKRLQLKGPPEGWVNVCAGEKISILHHNDDLRSLEWDL